MQRFVVRVGRCQFRQFRYGVVGAAESQVRLHARACRLPAQGLRAGRGGAVGEVREGGAAPQGEGLGQGVFGGRGIVVVEGRPALSYEGFEDVEVDVVVGRREAVAAGVRGDGVSAEGAAEAAYEGLEGCGGVVGRGVRPDLVDEGFGGGGAVGA